MTTEGIVDTLPIEESQANAPPVVSSRSGRRVRFPKHLVDFLPSMATPLAHIPSRQTMILQRVETHIHSPQEPTAQDDLANPEPHALPVEWFDTTPNGYGVFRSYPGRPTSNPEAGISLDSVCDSPGFAVAPSTAVSSTATPMNGAVSESAGDPPGVAVGQPTAVVSTAPPTQFAQPASSTTPFANRTAELLMGWHHSGSSLKSGGEFDRLLQTLRHPNFKLEELLHLSFARETLRLDKHMANPENALHERYGWRRATVDIHLPPVNKESAKPEVESPTFQISGVYHRRIINIIRTTYSGPTSRTFHFTPFRQYWRPTPDSPAMSLYSEIYSSSAMLDAHLEVCAVPRSGPDDTHERAIVPLMLWSDSTHLANFGTASLWPFYLLFGSQSKYTRAKPTTRSCHHLAYIPKVRTSQYIISGIYKTHPWFPAPRYYSGGLPEYLWPVGNSSNAQDVQT